MRIKNWAASVAVAALVLALCGLGGAAEDDESGALKAAETWLALVDSGKYDQSWENAASPFKTAVEKSQWDRSLTGLRKPLGKVLSRKLKEKKFVTQMPGSPDGKYVLIQFNSSFENKKSAVETVVPMLNSDGRWKVSGYYIK